MVLETFKMIATDQ